VDIKVFLPVTVLNITTVLGMGLFWRHISTVVSYLLASRQP